MKTLTAKIPTVLVDAFNVSTLTPKQKSICIGIYNTLLFKIGEDQEEWFPLTGKILLSNYGNDYSICLHFLLEHKIVLRSSSYCPGAYSYYYKLNSIIYLSSISFIYDYYLRESKSNQPNKKKGLAQEKQVPISKEILKSTNVNLKKLNFDFKAAENWIEASENPIHKKLQWSNSLSALEYKNYYCKRNTTNTRLDTNITNLKGELLKFATLDKETIASIDLSNSQLCFLIQLMKEKTTGKEKEIAELNKYISNGTFYEYIQTLLELRTRGEAKKLTFLLLFSKSTLRSNEKAKLRKVLPFLVDFCDSFKVANGENQLAITLQTKEAKLFIDGILKECLKLKLIVLSKHDSILCKESDIEIVTTIINKYLMKSLEENNFKLKIELMKKKLEKESKEIRREIKHLCSYKHLSEEESDEISNIVSDLEIRYEKVEKTIKYLTDEEYFKLAVERSKQKLAI